MEIPESIIGPVKDYFDGDLEKVSLWINAENPQLGGVSPCEMLLMGREDRLQKFIDEAMFHNIPKGTK